MQILPPGTRIGQYEIASRPMKGGMGVVYFALDHGNDGRPVALKTFRPELLPDRAARDRFLQEGTAWIELGSHPHIVRCYKVEYIDPTAFLALELIAKEQNMPDASLRSWLIPRQPLPLEQALLFALQIARGMKYATEKIPGFVHRDLKPENILVGTDKMPGTSINRLRVTDFGLVKTIADSGVLPITNNAEKLKPSQVQFTRGVGTPLYMAPEQWKGEPVGVFTDIYAFGCILYEMLAGQNAASGETLTELQQSHCNEKLRPIPRSFPKEMEEVTTKCLSLRSTHRFVTWKEITDLLNLAYAEFSGRDTPDAVAMGQVSREEHVQNGRSYIAIGAAYYHMGKIEKSADYFKKALSTTREIGDRRGEGTALGNLGNVYADLGEVRQAIGYYEQHLTISLEIEDRLGEANALDNLGIAYKELGEVKRAIGYYEQSLTIAREIGDQLRMGSALGSLGAAYVALGEVQRAIGYYEQSLTIAREIGNLREESSALCGLGSAYFFLGEVQSAVEYFEQSLVISREIGDRDGEGVALSYLGNSLAELGEVQQAIKYHEKSLVIARETGNRTGEGVSLGELGNMFVKLGEMQQAIKYNEGSLVIARQTGDRRGEGRALGNLGLSYKYLGEVQRAIGYFEQHLAIARETEDLHGEVNALCNLGLAYKNLEKALQAIGCFEQALAISSRIGYRRGEGANLNNLGDAYRTIGDVRLAIGYYERALVIDKEIEDLMGIATVSGNMAILYMQQGETNRALEYAQESVRLFNQVGHIPNAQRAQQIVDQLKNKQNPSILGRLFGRKG